MLIKIFSAYRAAQIMALQVITGTPPIDLQVRGGQHVHENGGIIINALEKLPGRHGKTDEIMRPAKLNGQKN